jgi:hypothetical protein
MTEKVTSAVVSMLVSYECEAAGEVALAMEVQGLMPMRFEC